MELETVYIEELDREKGLIVILDTNFLFITFKYPIDIIRELERVLDENYGLYIVESTIDELEKIKEKKKKDKKYLKLVWTFLRKYGFKVIRSYNSYADKEILKAITKNRRIIVATMDKALRREIKKNQGRCIVFRQKQYLEIV